MIRLALLIVLASLLASCGRISRAAQCRDLAAKVNGTLDGVEAELDASTGNPALLRDISGRYERLAGDVESFVRRDDGHGRTLREYAALFRDTGRQVREFADALERHDTFGALKARRELSALARRDKPLVTRVESACLE